MAQVPEGHTFWRAPIFVEEVVVTGFGRGSKQMGVPTANLRPEDLFSGPLKDLPLGVYFGYPLPAHLDCECCRSVCCSLMLIQFHSTTQISFQGASALRQN